MVRITDKTFVYTPSYDTDLKTKFRLIMERQRRAALKGDKQVHSVRPTVVPIGASVAREVRSEAM